MVVKEGATPIVGVERVENRGKIELRHNIGRKHLLPPCGNDSRVRGRRVFTNGLKCFFSC